VLLREREKERVCVYSDKGIVSLKREIEREVKKIRERYRRGVGRRIIKMKR